MAQMGRIGGPLLADNLLRNGSNLAFDTKVLYFDVVNRRIGMNSASPVNDLYAPNNIDTTNLIVDNSASIANFVISSNQIQNLFSTITISPNQSSNPTIVTQGISTANLTINSNLIAANTSDTDVNLTASGSGQVKLNNDVLVSGLLHATGNITFDGNITLGNAPSDTINIKAEVNSDIIPNITNTWDLGSSTNTWATIYSNNLVTNTTNYTDLYAGTLNAGNVTVNGNTISSTGNVNLVPNGSGLPLFNGFRYVTNNNINNPLPELPLTLSSTNSGYFKFAGSTGLVMPGGASIDKPAGAEMGTVRYNTTTGVLEVYDTNLIRWLPVIGVSPVLSHSEVTDVSFIWDLILG
jgi:hypothetical protein